MYNPDTHTFTLPKEAELRQRLAKVIASYSDGEVFLDAILSHRDAALSPQEFADIFVKATGNFVFNVQSGLDYFIFLRQAVNMIFVPASRDDAPLPGLARYRAELHTALETAKAAWLREKRDRVTTGREFV